MGGGQKRTYQANFARIFLLKKNFLKINEECFVNIPRVTRIRCKHWGFLLLWFFRVLLSRHCRHSADQVKGQGFGEESAGICQKQPTVGPQTGLLLSVAVV